MLFGGLEGTEVEDEMDGGLVGEKGHWLLGVGECLSVCLSVPVLVPLAGMRNISGRIIKVEAALRSRWDGGMDWTGM